MCCLHTETTTPLQGTIIIKMTVKNKRQQTSERPLEHRNTTIIAETTINSKRENDIKFRLILHSNFILMNTFTSLKIVIRINKNKNE